MTQVLPTNSDAYYEGVQRRIITSAIPEMTVAEVRRGLAQIRLRWEEMMSDDTMSRPLLVSEELGIRDISMQIFCHRFVGGHHAKRLRKTNNSVLVSS
jgi:hypothetical protein